jgi:DNA-binding NarL/FixJ family response regulator
MNSASLTKPVLIVEKCPLAAYAMKALVCEAEREADVTIAGSAQTAMEKLSQPASWFRCFIGVDVPCSYGLSLVRHFAQMGLAHRSAVLADSENGKWQVETHGMGLLGFLVKAQPIEAFTSSVGDVLSGQQVFRQSAASQQYERRVHLTRRQQDVLELLHRGYSSKKIAAQLQLNAGTVDNHVSGLMRALNVSSRAQAITMAIELGHVQCQRM